MWQERFEELVEYKAKHGNCLVPSRYSANLKLGYWVMTQRRQYQVRKENEGKSLLTCSQIKKLDKLGFSWVVREDYAVTWKKRFDELICYHQKHGDFNIPQRYAPNPKLGTWVNTQRRGYSKLMRGLPSGMTKTKIDKLNSVGFPWSSRKRRPKKVLKDGSNFSAVQRREICQVREEVIKTQERNIDVIKSAELNEFKSIPNKVIDARSYNNLSSPETARFFQREIRVPDACFQRREREMCKMNENQNQDSYYNFLKSVGKCQPLLNDRYGIRSYNKQSYSRHIQSFLNETYDKVALYRQLFALQSEAFALDVKNLLGSSRLADNV